MKRKTTEQYKREVYDTFKNEYTVLGEYINSNHKILVRHNKCGREYSVVPSSLLRGHGCLKCFRKEKLNKEKRISKEEVLEYIKLNKNNEFELIDYFYINGALQITTRHLKCNNIHTQTFQNFKKCLGCPVCAKKQRSKTRSKTNKTFLKEVKELTGDEYIFLEKYNGCDTKIKVKHNECGYIYYVTPSKFINGRRCPECAKKIRNNSKTMTNKEFVLKLKNIWGNEIIPLTKYKKSNIKIKVKHSNCGHEWNVIPASLLMGTGCPKCGAMNSKGERKIEQFLKKNNIYHKREYMFKECKNIFPLPFDFYIPHKDICIEYDGEQHYKPIEYFGGVKKFKRLKRNDNIKNKYCKENNIKLIRIKYSQYKNIDKILKKILQD